MAKRRTACEQNSWFELSTHVSFIDQGNNCIMDAYVLTHVLTLNKTSNESRRLSDFFHTVNVYIPLWHPDTKSHSGIEQLQTL